MIQTKVKGFGHRKIREIIKNLEVIKKPMFHYSFQLKLMHLSLFAEVVGLPKTASSYFPGSGDTVISKAVPPG